MKDEQKGVARHLGKMEATVHTRKQQEHRLGDRAAGETGSGHTMKGLGILVLESQLFPKSNRNPLKGLSQKMT